MKYKKIEDAQIGEIGFCVPWAFNVMSDGSYGIRGSHHFDKTGGGSLKLKVTRTEQGFLLDFSLCPDDFYDEPLYDLRFLEDEYLPVIGVYVP